MSLKEIIEKFGKGDEDFKQAKKEEKIREAIERVKKTPNERELERRMEEKRQKEIDTQLQRLKDEEREGILKSQMMGKDNMFSKPEGNNLLKQPSIFKIDRGSNLFFS